MFCKLGIELALPNIINTKVDDHNSSLEGLPFLTNISRISQSLTSGVQHFSFLQSMINFMPIANFSSYGKF